MSDQGPLKREHPTLFMLFSHRYYRRNLRLIDWLMGQVRRIKEINQLSTVTREVVDAARDCLVIGSS